MTIGIFPREVWGKICPFLNLDKAAQFYKTCKALNEILAQRMSIHKNNYQYLTNTLINTKFIYYKKSGDIADIAKIEKHILFEFALENNLLEISSPKLLFVKPRFIGRNQLLVLPTFETTKQKYLSRRDSYTKQDCYIQKQSSASSIPEKLKITKVKVVSETCDLVLESLIKRANIRANATLNLLTFF